MAGRSRALATTACAVLCLATGAAAQLRKSAALSDAEEDQLREAQDAGERIIAYMNIAQARLDRFDQFRDERHDPKYDNGGYLDKLLGDYIAVNDEMKDWIDEQYQREADMRKGLRALLDRGPQQLAELKHFQDTPDADTPAYGGSLRDAIEDLSDTLDGGGKALADQEKRFGELKREQKAAAEQQKQSEKEQRKQLKEEKKLRKHEQKHGVPEDPDQD